jgi:hypothetical protein
LEACWKHVGSMGKHGKRIAKLHRSTLKWNDSEWFGMMECWRWRMTMMIEAYQGTGGLQPRHSNEAWVDGMMEWWIYSYDKYYINMKGSVHRIYGESMYV